MKIAGIEKTSFVDFPGKLAAVLFTPGCNLDCFYCHNRSLLGGTGRFETYYPETLMEWLKERAGFLDGVVITGGEPTLQPDLAAFIRRIRTVGYAVKLDTNGTRPGLLGDLVNERLLDFVAMDLKAPMEKYEAFCGAPVDHGAINASIDLLLSDRVDYEFRATVVPQLTEDDLVAMSRRIRGAKRFVLQQYRRPEPFDGFTDPRLDDTPHSPEWAARVALRLEDFVACCETRGFGLERSAAVAASS